LNCCVRTGVNTLPQWQKNAFPLVIAVPKNSDVATHGKDAAQQEL
jgi:hypothetical protein